MKFVVAFLTIISLSSFKNDTFEKNKFFYEAFLSSQETLSDTGKLHLLSLRSLINQRLENHKGLHEDSIEIWELIDSDVYLREEFYRRYSPLPARTYKDIFIFVRDIPFYYSDWDY